MVYRNTDSGAVEALERDRTGDYGDVKARITGRGYLLGLCECTGCSNEIYSKDIYGRVREYNGPAECRAFGGDGDVRLICESCLYSL